MNSYETAFFSILDNKPLCFYNSLEFTFSIWCKKLILWHRRRHSIIFILQVRKCPLALRFQVEYSITWDSIPVFAPHLYILCLLSSITPVPMEHSHKLGLHGPKILTQLQTLRVSLEEACVRCFDLIKLMRAKGKETYHKAHRRRSFFCIPDVASSTEQAAMQYWLDRTSTSAMSVSSGSMWFLHCKIKPNSGNKKSKTKQKS